MPCAPRSFCFTSQIYSNILGFILYCIFTCAGRKLRNLRSTSVILLHTGKPPAFSMHLPSCPAGFRRLQVQSRAPFSANFAMMAFSRVEHSSQTSIYAAPLLCWLLSFVASLSRCFLWLSFVASKEQRPRFWLHASHLWSVLSCLVMPLSLHARQSRRVAW